MAETQQQGQDGSTPAKGGYIVRPERHKRKNRRWLLVLLLMILLGLIVAAGLAPRVLSTDWGRQRALDLANERLKGRVDVEHIELTWTGPCRVSGIAVWDTQGRNVLEIESVEYANGLVMLMAKPEIFERVVAKSPEVTLYLDEQGKASIAEALSPIEPARKPTKAMPAPMGVAEVKSATVLLVNAKGESYLVENIDGRIGIGALSGLHGTLEFAPAGAGGRRVAGSFDLDGLIGMEGISLETASGEFSLATDGPVDMTELAKFLGEDDLRGTVSLDISGKLSGGKFTAELSADAGRISSAGLDPQTVRPLDVSLTGSAAWSEDGGTASARLTSQAGQLEASLSYREGWPDSRLGSIPQAMVDVLYGRRSSLPEFAATLSGAVDIPALAKAVPAVLHMQQDVKVSSGLVEIDSVEVIGGKSPSVVARASLRNLRAERRGAAISPARVELSLDALLGDQAGPNIRTASFRSGFAEVNVGGNVEDMSGKLKLDLAKFHRELGGIFDLADVPPRGELDGNLRLYRQDEDPKDESHFDVGIGIRNLAYTLGGRESQLETAELKSKGRLKTANHRPVKAIVQAGRLEMAEHLRASFTGSHDFRRRTFDWQVNLQRAELGRLSELASGDGSSLPARLGGTAEMAASLSRKAPAGPIESTGSAAVTKLTLDGAPLASGALGIEWSDAQYRPDAKAVRIASGSLGNDFLKITARPLQLALADRVEASGDLELTADLGECAAAAAALAKWNSSPEIDGDLHWKGQLSSNQDEVTAKGAASVKEFSVVVDGEQVLLDQVKIDHDAVLDTKARKVRFDRLAVSTEPLSLQTTGTVEGLQDRWELDLQGSYEGSWDKLMPILYKLVPNAEQRLLLAGRRGGKFAIKGPARQSDLKPIFRGLSANTALGWERAEMLGIKLSEAEIAPKLTDGVLDIPTTEIPAESGKARVAGRIDFTGSQATYRLAERVVFLQELPVTQQISKDLLSRVNPVFAETTSITGKVSLAAEDLVLPLGKEISESARGRGRLDLKQLKVAPEGILAELLRFGFADPATSRQMSVRGVDFVIRDGRVHYDDLALVFSEDFELGFRGSVGFDDTIEMAVSVPVSAALLERFGVRGPVGEYARVLDRMRVEIPLVGTRMNPRLDMSQVDIGSLVQQAAEALLSEQAGKIISDILKGPQPEPDKPGEPGTQPADPADSVDLDGLLEGVFDLLKEPK